jgi:stalled ribosome alternative rescue factor ArfA
MKRKKQRKRSVIAKDLFTPKYKPKTETKKKGKGSFDRGEFGIRDMKETISEE